MLHPLPTPSPSRARPGVSRAVTRPLTLPPLPRDPSIKSQLDRILHSRTFRDARRSQLFLRYILHHTLAHPAEPLKEYCIALDVFDRDTSYDPAVNNTVRVEAGRLRSRLLEYYAGEGHADPLLIEVPKGSYRVRIHPCESTPPAALSIPPRRTEPRIVHLWALPLAFIIGALVGYRASH